MKEGTDCPSIDCPIVHARSCSLIWTIIALIHPMQYPVPWIQSVSDFISSNCVPWTNINQSPPQSLNSNRSIFISCPIVSRESLLHPMLDHVPGIQSARSSFSNSISWIQTITIPSSILCSILSLESRQSRSLPPSYARFCPLNLISPHLHLMPNCVPWINIHHSPPPSHARLYHLNPDNVTSSTSAPSCPLNPNSPLLHPMLGSCDLTN